MQEKADIAQGAGVALRVDAERTRIYLDRAVAASLTSPVGTLLLAWIQAPVAGWETALVWFCLIQSCELMTIANGYRFRRKPRADSEAAAWANRQVMIHTLTALAWGSSALLFRVPGELTYHLVNLAILTAVSAISITIMSPFRRAVVLFFCAIWFLPMVQLLQLGDRFYLQLALGIAILLALEVQYAFVANRQLVTGIGNSVRNTILIQELSLARQAVDEANARLESKNAELSAAATRLGELASRDDLTGAYNRRFAVEQLEQQVALKSRYRTEASLVLFDLDHFKRVNDTYGHPAGDAVLKEVAARARGVLRDGDVLARFGGEEFVALLPVSGLAAAASFAERLRGALGDHPMYLGSNQTLAVHASFGVAELLPDENVTAWVARADKALYRAKESGRNRVEVDGELAPVVRKIV